MLVYFVMQPNEVGRGSAKSTGPRRRLEIVFDLSNALSYGKRLVGEEGRGKGYFARLRDRRHLVAFCFLE